MLQEQTNELPALKGTEKQVTWANKIRSDFLAAIDLDAANRLKYSTWKKITPEKREQFLNYVEKCKNKLILQTEASWWIDKRFRAADDHVHAHCWSKVF